ncbi:winged helix-turn-helix transcriptional regulator [Streptococcus oricebi]|uniref:Transcriptional regulator n=1 Tax=Streptococcus oricebi TaxID=1547447 RepID=A0ABS5B100_9STRE|nr:helix-turn-helix domain-containing protein [Streptococcus oricebi]MBP2622510.1 transcriptional regulator [Streptococcus oricebi]
MKSEKCQNQPCPVETTLKLIGGKWKGLLIYRLLDGKKRFSQLQKLIPSITHRSLSLQLKELEAAGLVKRTVYPEVPPKVEYELTVLGQSMSSIIYAIYDWGKFYQEGHK